MIGVLILLACGAAAIWAGMRRKLLVGVLGMSVLVAGFTPFAPALAAALDRLAGDPLPELVVDLKASLLLIAFALPSLLVGAVAFGFPAGLLLRAENRRRAREGSTP